MEKKYQYAIRWSLDEFDGCHWFGENDIADSSLFEAGCTVTKSRRRLFDDKELAVLNLKLLNYGLSKGNGYKLIRIRVRV